MIEMASQMGVGSGSRKKGVKLSPLDLALNRLGAKQTGPIVMPPAEEATRIANLQVKAEPRNTLFEGVLLRRNELLQ